MRRLLVALLLVFAATAQGQTATPTLMPVGNTGSTDWSAYHYGSFRFEPGALDAIESDEVTVLIPGIQVGDSIIIYPAAVCADGVSDGSATVCFERGLAYTGVRVIANNQIAVRWSNLTASSVTATPGDWTYLWFNRTKQNQAQAAAATVTPTP